MSETSLLFMFSNKCPRCARGPILVGFLKMADTCTSCGFNYIQETGMHWGAMVLAYMIGAMIAFPLFFALLFQRASAPVALGVPIAVLICISPFTVRYTRIAWVHILYYLNPPRDEKR